MSTTNDIITEMGLRIAALEADVRGANKRIDQKETTLDWLSDRVASIEKEMEEVDSAHWAANFKEDPIPFDEWVKKGERQTRGMAPRDDDYLNAMAIDLSNLEEKVARLEDDDNKVFEAIWDRLEELEEKVADIDRARPILVEHITELQTSKTQQRADHTKLLRRVEELEARADEQGGKPPDGATPFKDLANGYVIRTWDTIVKRPADTEMAQASDRHHKGEGRTVSVEEAFSDWPDSVKDRWAREGNDTAMLKRLARAEPNELGIVVEVDGHRFAGAAPLLKYINTGEV